MCRLMAFMASHPMLLADVVLYPDRSIIKQSYDARERKRDPTLPFHLGHGNLNGDGFGIGWFCTDDRREKDPAPCVFTSITPAWNNENLSRLASKIVSPLVFAHVRAAYPGMPVSEQNCHPFQWGRYMWMHNGVVGGFAQIRRDLLGSLSDAAYNSISSFHSDSAVSFAVFLHHLPDMSSQHPPEVLLRAMQATLASISALQRKHGIEDTSLLNYVVSDGLTLIATRFVHPESEGPASLYYAEGSSFSRALMPGEPDPNAGCGPDGGGCGDGATTPQGFKLCNSASGSSIIKESSYQLGFGERGARVAFVASEPITASSTDWVAVPKNTALVISREKGGFLNIMRCPITPSCVTDSRREVSLCLEAVSRGLRAKARAWVVRGLPAVGGSMQQPIYMANGLTSQSGSGFYGEGAGAGGLARQGSSEQLHSLYSIPPLAGYPSGLHGVSRTTSYGGGADGDELPDDSHDFMRLTGHAGPVITMLRDEVGARLYSAAVDCSIKIWSLTDNRCIHTLLGHKKPVTAMVLRGAGRWLYTASGRRVRVFDTTNYACVHTMMMTDSCGTIRALQVVDGRIFVGAQDTTVKAFAIDESTFAAQSASLTAARSPSSTPAPSVGLGPTRASGPSRTTSNSNSQVPLPISNGHAVSTGPPSSPSLTVAGATTTSPSPGFSDVPPPASVADMVTDELSSHVAAVNALAVCGRYICSAGCDAMIHVWNVADLKLVSILRGHRGSVLCLLAVGNLLLSGARDNTIRVWDLDMDMMCRCTLTGHKDDVTSLSSVTLKRRYASVADADDMAALMRQGASARTMLAYTVIASASADGTVRLWSMRWSCLCILSLPQVSGPMPWVRTQQTSQSQQHQPMCSDLLPSSHHHSHTNGSTVGSGEVTTDTAANIFIPNALCSSLSSGMVMAGYSDGEIRMWHCEDVHLAALRMCAADLAALDPGILCAGLPLCNGGSNGPKGILNGSSVPIGKLSTATANMYLPGGDVFSGGSTPHVRDSVLTLQQVLSPTMSIGIGSGDRNSSHGAVMAEDVMRRSASFGRHLSESVNVSEAAALPADEFLSADLSPLADDVRIGVLNGSPHASVATSATADSSLLGDLASLLAAAPGAGSIATPSQQPLTASSPTTNGLTGRPPLPVATSGSASGSPSSIPIVPSSTAFPYPYLMPSAPAYVHSLSVAAPDQGQLSSINIAGSLQRVSAPAASPPQPHVAVPQLSAYAVQKPSSTGVYCSMPTHNTMLRSAMQSSDGGGDVGYGYQPVYEISHGSSGEYDDSHYQLEPISARSGMAKGSSNTTSTSAYASPSTKQSGPPFLFARTQSGNLVLAPPCTSAAAAGATSGGAIATGTSSALLLRRQQMQPQQQPASPTGNGSASLLQPQPRAQVYGRATADGAGGWTTLPSGHEHSRHHHHHHVLQQQLRPGVTVPVHIQGRRSPWGHGSWLGPERVLGTDLTASATPPVATAPAGLASTGSGIPGSMSSTGLMPGGSFSTTATLNHSLSQPCNSVVASNRCAYGFSNDGTVSRNRATALAALANGHDKTAVDGLGVPFGSYIEPPQVDLLMSKLLEQRLARQGSLLSAGVGSTDAQLEQCLREFVRFKTISASPKMRDDCLRGAKYLAKLLESLGADVKTVQVYEDKNPVVIGRLGHALDKPTVTFYGHYDVQPAAEPDWRTNPFELNSVNEYLYGRGTSDNKGPILAFIFAVKELLAIHSADGSKSGLDVNIAFIFEGEEENGSRGFREAVTQNLHWFEGTQLIIISNTVWVGENVPCLTYGMRGMLSLSIQISGPERDVHSGNDGGVFDEPMVDLLKVMATLIGSSSDIRVAGFNDNVCPHLIDRAWSSLEDSAEFSLQGYQEALGVPSLTAPPSKRDLLVARWCKPSLSVVDMRPSHGAGSAGSDATNCYRFGPTRFSVIPRMAEGKVSVRFVPAQDADNLVSCLREHVYSEFKKLGTSNVISLHVEARGNWWEADTNTPWLRMAEAAITREWGVPPLYVREGGTMPVASLLEHMLSAPAIMIPLGQSSDNGHLANERIRRCNLFRGKDVIRSFLQEIAAAGGVGSGAATEAPQQQQQDGAIAVPLIGVDQEGDCKALHYTSSPFQSTGHSPPDASGMGPLCAASNGSGSGIHIIGGAAGAFASTGLPMAPQSSMGPHSSLALPM